MSELSDEVYTQITEISQFGEALFETYNFESAILQYKKALNLVPTPKTNWEASTWLYTAIGDCYFELKQYPKASNAFFDALNCPDAQSNPFINLRLGECLFELNDKEQASEYLMRAYMLEGKQIFDSEAEKYFNLIQEKFDL
ncbi:MAG: hypothetical protein MI810_25160 [Flavobacteriales bacterium]|jgi:tetratricopeptide (TPR) repeat protein|nr:hypothetical protein [Flavobacteriales bacterium]